jgi:hypothetical protein
MRRGSLIAATGNASALSGSFGGILTTSPLWVAQRLPS